MLLSVWSSILFLVDCGAKSDNMYLLCTTLFISIIVSCNFYLATVVFAASPEFDRQDISGGSGWLPVLPNTHAVGKGEEAAYIENCNTKKQHISVPHIREVNYFSNGKTLDATVWLSSFLNPPTIIRYVMLISIDSVYHLGQPGYTIDVTWNAITHKWSEEIRQRPENLSSSRGQDY